MKKISCLILILLLAFISRAQLPSEEALAVQYYQAGQFDKAAVVYGKLYEHTKNKGYYDPYFNCLLKTKQYKVAEDLARRLMKNEPGNYTYAIDLGRVYQERGEQDKSTELFNELIRELPTNEFAIKDLAITFYRAEAYDFSIKTLLNGRKILEDEKAFSYDLLSLYRYRKDKPNLIQEYLLILDTNPEILPQAKNVLGNILEHPDDFYMLRTALLRRLQKDPQNIALTELLSWQYLQQKEFDMALRQTLALDRRLKEDGRRIFELSRILISNEAYNQAVEALKYLVDKGSKNTYYIPARVDLLNVKSRQLTSDKFDMTQLQALERDYLSLLDEFGRRSGTSFAIRQLARLQAFYLQKPEDAAALLAGMIALPGIPPPVLAETKLELGDIYILANEVWEAALLYGQVEKQFPDEPSGQLARFKNAMLSYYQGDFIWSKAQLDVLKSSTSQLIANDALNLGLLISDNLQNEQDTAALTKYAEADLLIYKNDVAKAMNVLDSLNILYPGNSLTDDILMAKAKIFLKQNEFDKAAIELQSIVSDHAGDLWGDDAVFILADLYEKKLNQPDMARELYERIITDFPGSLYVIEARKRFRLLRGDKLG